MKTEGTLYRPPAEANTFLLQVTAGCTHNACRFCNMYKDKPFHLIDDDTLKFNLAEEKRIRDIYGRPHKRIFLMDGDVFSLSADKLEQKLELIRHYMPELEVISMYAAVRSIKSKSDADLQRLKALGVNDLYIGYESALDDVLEYMNKGTTVADSIEQANRLNDVGIGHRALMVLGLAGAGRCEESGRATADFINIIKPNFTRLATLSIFDGTELAADVSCGKFVEAGELENLKEQKIILENLKVGEDGLDPNMRFIATHISNSVPMDGFLGRDRDWMLKKLERSIDEFDEEKFKKTVRRTFL